MILVKSPEEGLAEFLRLYNSDDDSRYSRDFLSIAFSAAYFGDLGFALNAMMRCVNSNPDLLFWIWSPGMREVRQLPRFKKYREEKSLVDYWNRFGWPDLCHPVGEDDFVCD